MFINGVYNEAELKMIENWKTTAAKDVGWLDGTPSPTNDHPINLRKATREIIRHMALAHDYKNPLYRNEDYAKYSKYGKIIAPPFLTNCIACGHAHFLEVPKDVGQFLGCHLGEDYVWYRTIVEDDSFTVFQGMPQMRDMTPAGEQQERVMGSFDPCYIYDQNGELIAEWWHILVTVYAGWDVERDNILRIGYELDMESALKLGEGALWTPRPKYTQELADTIQRLYEEEPRRGKEIRWWEDVEIGETLPPVYMGPISYWDCVAYMCTFVHPPINMMEGRRLTPQKMIKDPETNITFYDFEFHLCEETPKLVGWYSHTIVDPFINSFLGRMTSNWMGDDGEFRRYKWRKFANTTIGDSIIGRGRVIRKYIEDGECRVDIDVCMENIKGFLANMGPTTISLPSKRKFLERLEPVTDSEETELDLNPEGIKRGDCFRVKPRPDWELPYDYPLAGKTGYVYELPMDVEGFVYAIMDEDCTGIEHRAVVGFRMTDIEKI